MLTDLRDKLKGVGRIDVMDAVNQRAMIHYQNQSDLARLPDDSLERRARVLLAMGEDDQTRDKLDEALKKFRAAHRVTSTLITREPYQADRVFAHAQSEFWIGYAHYLNGNYDSAEPFLLAYQKLANRLANLPGQRRRGTLEKAYAAGNLCALSFKRGDKPAISENTCRGAVAAQRALVQIEPRDIDARTSLANSLAWEADAAEMNSNLLAAQDRRTEQISILNELIADDPKNLDIAEFRLTALIAMARLQAKTGKKSSAIIQLRHQQALAEKLKRHDPENAVWAKRGQEIEQLLHSLLNDNKNG